MLYSQVIIQHPIVFWSCTMNLFQNQI